MPEFVADSTFVQDGSSPSPREPGRLGWQLFYNANLLIDVNHSTIAFSDSIETLEKYGYSSSDFVQTPLFLERGVVEFDVDTSNGLVRCMLDIPK